MFDIWLIFIFFVLSFENVLGIWGFLFLFCFELYDGSGVDIGFFLVGWFGF